MPKQTNCRQCGKPRSLNTSAALCADCLNAYHRERYRRQRNGGQTRQWGTNAAPERRRDLERAYARLGLVEGQIWALARRKVGTTGS